MLFKTKENNSSTLVKTPPLMLLLYVSLGIITLSMFCAIIYFLYLIFK